MSAVRPCFVSLCLLVLYLRRARLTRNEGTVTGARPFYDLTNPVIFQRDEATVSETGSPARHQGSPDQVTQLQLAVSAAGFSDTGKADFESYAATLLASVVALSPAPGLSPTLEPVRSPSLMEAPPALRPEMSSHRGGGGAGPGVAAAGAALGEGLGGAAAEESGGCKAAVEIVSRNSQKGASLVGSSPLMTAR